MTIRYSIQFFSDWHCGSGLSSGAQADAEVLKDENNLPYLPGKTIKGLLRDALLEMPEEIAGISKERLNELFGFLVMDGASIKETKNGKGFFSNAELCREEKSDISKELSEYLFRNIVSTAIGANGISKEKSLRTIEVCMPVNLEGYIEGLEESDMDLIIKATKWVRHIGVNRNRGLGRCKIVVL